jgi:hypothetical protein
MRVLAESKRFTVEHEYELVRARDRVTGKSIELGYHFGDPRAAYISANQDWIIVAGEGLTVRRTLGPGPLIELFRDDSPPSNEELAIASPPDPEWPGNPWPERLYPVEISDIRFASEDVVQLRARPPFHLDSAWHLSLPSDATVTIRRPN